MKKSVVVLLHLSYWGCYFFLLHFIYILMRSSYNDETPPSRYFELMLCFAIIPALLSFYSFYYLLFNKFLITKKIWSLILVGISISFICVLIGIGVLNVLTRVDITFENLFKITLLFVVIPIFNGLLGLGLKAFISWYNDIQQKQILNKKNYEMELALVKNQLNPHFLFNTINNIDILIQKDPVKASDYLNKLSDIMRFMLYETKADKIALSTELNYIEKYIALQKIRSSNPSYVNYVVEGHSDGFSIEPMLFIPFIENAFKHTENKNWKNAIYIKITISKEMIIFDCENKFSDKSNDIKEHNGLGNGLIEKRLMLLYPNKHQLNISTLNNVYKVNLKLHHVN
ncbi:MAG: sensor histidine kinase [Bacteroidota bacterium]